MSTYHSIHYHIIFSTKYRKPWIKNDWIDRLHTYMGGAIKGMDAIPIQIGGVADHVHLLVGCKANHRPCDLVREIKKAATAWVHSEIENNMFGWQDGYAIFSVSPDSCPGVIRYIIGQAEHHRTRSFREELERILKRARIEYDPKYLE
jgi:REP element-mobilizing transposase RayT